MNLRLLAVLLLLPFPTFSQDKNPYLPSARPDRIILNVTQDPSTSMAVNWRTSTSVDAGFAEITPASADPRSTENATRLRAATTALHSEDGQYKDLAWEGVSANFHSVVFHDLEPNTLYNYRVGNEKEWSEWFQFSTAGTADDKLSFIYFGDAQTNVHSLWSKVIRQAYSQMPEARLMLHAGDLINRANRDEEWGEWFEAGSFIHATIPGMPSPGNHEHADWGGKEDHLSAFWRPQFTLPENGPEGLEESCYYADIQGVRFISLNSNLIEESEEFYARQKTWLEAKLKDNPNRWTCILLHHPFYSTKGDRDNPWLRKDFKPLMDKYNVDLVLQGHDHAYARGMEDIPMDGNEKPATMYVVSVSGPKMYDSEEKDWMDNQVGNTQLYQLITVEGERLTFKAYTSTGELYDAFDLIKRPGKPNKVINRAPRPTRKAAPAQGPAGPAQAPAGPAQVPAGPAQAPAAQPGTPELTASTALASYLHNDDTSYSWELAGSFQIGNVKGYDLVLTSQTWRGITWKHQLTILAPPEIRYDGALLFVTGGSLRDEVIKLKDKTDDLTRRFALTASKNNAIVGIIRQVPNQPLYGDLTEDALISFTLHQFQEDGDYTWPLLFPMVKSAVKAMDALQEFAGRELDHDVNRFLVSGASKRGWTTWLTGAMDTRVSAIAPMVIDVLNMPVNLEYQIEVWDEYSPQIRDYVDLEIPQQVHTETGAAITTMVDPYSYRANLTMPKMIFIGTNDEYWPVDAVKHYFDSLPGENYLHYVPNAGHDLGDGVQAFKALDAFFGYSLQNVPRPECTWAIAEKKERAAIRVEATEGQLVGATLWSADSDDRDFRDEEWVGKEVGTPGASEVTVTESFPAAGYEAFYIDLEYKDLNGGTFTKSTRVFVADSEGIL